MVYVGSAGIQKSTLIISGMHRSSTSLITQYLRLCGLTLGDDLLGAYKDNKDGYFENKSIVECHQQIIRSANKNLFTMRPVMSYPEDIKTKIKDVIDRNRTSRKTFAFKDPRNCLFIWPLNELCLDANNIFIFRDYREVIDSLLRRATDKELKIRPWLAAHSWIVYNEELLKYYDKNSDSSIIFEDAYLLHNDRNAIEKINEKFHLNLRYQPINKIFKPNLTKRDKKFSLKTKLICVIYGRKLERIYFELKRRAENHYF